MADKKLPLEKFAVPFHVIPTNDSRPHANAGMGCRCKPRKEVKDGATLIIHNSFDGREFFEPDNKNICEITGKKPVKGSTDPVS